MRKYLLAASLALSITTAPPAKSADYAVGDSLTDTTGQTVTGYVAQLNTRLPTTFNLIAHGGDMVGDQANKVYAVTPVAGDRSVVMLRVNDQRIYGVNATKQVYSNDGLRNILVWLGTASKRLARGGGVESGASWVNASTNSVGRTATTAGDYTTFEITGTTAYVSLQTPNSGGGSYSIFIDGTLLGTFNSTETGNTTYNGWSLNERLHRLAGLSAGIHIVKVAVVTGPVTVEFAAGNYQSARPSVYVGNTIKAAPGYSLGGSAANVIAYNADEAQIVSDLRSDGLNIWPLDVYSILNDTTDLSPVDGLHPVQSGQDKLANAFYGAMTAFQSLPSGFTLTPTPTWNGSDGNLYAGSDAAHLSLLSAQPVTISGGTPPPPPPPPGGTCTDISATGTTFGNMDGYAGKSSVFSNAGAAAYSASAGGPTNGTGFVGKSLSTPTVPCKAVVWGSDGTGTVHWSTGSNSDTITLKYMGKNGTCDGTGGDQLATASFSNGAAPAAQALTTSTSMAYSCLWATVTSSAPGGGVEIISSLRLWGLQ